MNLGLLSIGLSLSTFAFSTFAGVEQSIETLLPRLAAEKVEDRYSAQMELQGLAANASRPGADAERTEFAKALAAKASDPAAPQPARVWLVRQLEYIGSAESVPSLAGLLNDSNAELKECARRALEKNSSPTATEKLRAALQQSTEPNWKLGLIQSLGQRGDVLSVNLIAAELDKSEAGFTAAAALAKIANEAAVQSLWSVYERKNSWAGDALIKAGNRLATRAEGKRSIAIFTKIYSSPAPSRLRAAALNGLAKADPAGTKKLIAQSLVDPDSRLQYAAVTAALEVYGTNATPAVVPLLAKVSDGAKILLLRILDRSAEAQVIAAANDSQESVKTAALERLGVIGTAASVPVLMKAAEANPSVLQRTGRASLARVSAPGVDGAIAEQAAHGASTSRATAISVLADRNNSTYLPKFVEYANEPDPVVSSAACTALGKLATEKELSSLARLAMAGKTSGADAALQSVAARAQHKAAAANELISLSEGTELKHPGLLFDTLAILGGDEALVVVSKAALGGNDEVKDAAIRALSNWADFPACTQLLQVAKDPDSKKVYNVLAIQGIARLVKSSDKEPVHARLDVASTALALAQRDEEKKLLLSAVASVPDAKSAEILKPFLKEAQFQPEAGLAGDTLAQSLLSTDPAAAKSLAQAVKESGASAEAIRKAEAILRRAGGS